MDKTGAQIDRNRLTEAEALVWDRTLEGRTADFSGEAVKPRIGGAFLSQLGLARPPRGIRVVGAEIDGDVDLARAELRGLELEACDIPGSVDVGAARLGRLSIRGSRFRRLFAKGARIDGGLDFASTSAHGPEAWIDASCATIHGAIDGCDAKLRAPAARRRDEVLPWAHNYALRLSDSRVHGSLYLNGSFVADGGFSMDDAIVHGGVKARGATFIAGEDDPYHPGDSFRAHAARIDGHCEFGFGFTTVGRMWMVGAKIGDRLSIGMVSGSLSKPRQTWDWANRVINSGAALMCEQIEVSGAFLIISSKIDGTVSLNDARIGATARILHTTISNPSEDGSALAFSADRARFAHGLTLGSESRFEGRTSLSQAQIGGHLDLRGGQFDNAANTGSALALDLSWARVEQAILPAPLAAGAQAAETPISGQLSVDRLQTGL